MRGLFLVLIMFLLTSCQPVPTVEAAPIIPPCLEKGKMGAQIYKHFREEPLIVGTVKDGAFMTISANGRGWTMTRTVNALECLWLLGNGLLKIIDHRVEKVDANN